MQTNTLALDKSPVGREFVGLPIDCEFVRMQFAYESTGGLAKKDDLAGWLENLQPGTSANLAELISSGAIFAFRWHGEHWIPLFQIDPADLSVNPASRQVVAALGGVFDGWTLATWFAGPNSLLANKRPVEMLDSDIAAVLDAARVDRFVAAG